MVDDRNRLDFRYLDSRITDSKQGVGLVLVLLCFWHLSGLRIYVWCPKDISNVRHNYRDWCKALGSPGELILSTYASEHRPSRGQGSRRNPPPPTGKEK